MQIAAAQCGTSEVDGLHPTKVAFLRWIIQAYSTIPLLPVPRTICWLGNNLTITALMCVCHVVLATAATPSAFALSWNQVPAATPMTYMIVQKMATCSKSFPTTQVAQGSKFNCLGLSMRYGVWKTFELHIYYSSSSLLFWKCSF